MFWQQWPAVHVGISHGTCCHYIHGFTSVNSFCLFAELLLGCGGILLQLYSGITTNSDWTEGCQHHRGTQIVCCACSFPHSFYHLLLPHSPNDWTLLSLIRHQVVMISEGRKNNLQRIFVIRSELKNLIRVCHNFWMQPLEAEFASDCGMAARPASFSCLYCTIAHTQVVLKLLWHNVQKCHMES